MPEDKTWLMPLGERQGAKDSPFREKKGNPVEEIKEGMKIVQETRMVAEELSGSQELKEERDKAKEALAQEREETHKKEQADINKKLDKALENKDVPAVRELERKLEEAKAAYHKEQLDGLRQGIEELRRQKGGAGGITEDVARLKSLKEASKELGLGGTSNEVPSAILLDMKKVDIELKKMDHDLQLKIEEMKDDRERRDKEWQLTVKKWDQERELRREEAKGKYEAEHERTTLIKSAIDRGARIMGRAVMEEEGALGQPPGQSISYRVEADEGEMGDFTCPKCSSTVVIAPDTVTAMCAKCGFRAKIERKTKPAGAPGEPQE